MWTIARLLPDMSPIGMFFRMVVEFVFPNHVVWHVAPGLKLSPGPGSLGVMSTSALQELAVWRKRHFFLIKEFDDVLSR